jgi:mRNA-degrading endonuclease toxin of MazEF toxin-antitoxin module
VVITTEGTNQIAKRMLWKRTNVNLKVREVIDCDTVKSLSMAELAAHVRKTVEDGLHQSSK